MDDFDFDLDFDFDGFQRSGNCSLTRREQRCGSRCMDTHSSQGRSWFGLRTVAVLSAVVIPLAWTAPVAAFDIPIEGKKTAAQSEPAGKRRFTFRGQSGPGAYFDPTSTGATTTLQVTEVDCDGDPADELCVATATSGVVDLDRTLWTPLGDPPGSKGYRYRDGSGTRSGVRSVLLHTSGRIAVKAVGDDWPLVPTGGGNGVQVRLNRVDTYCAEFGGIERRNQPGELVFKKAAPPAGCRGACGNGVVENGEGCDPPNGSTCDASCRLTCTSDPGNTLIACSSANDGTLALAGDGDTFLLAYAQVAGEGTRARAVRFDSLGQALDATPLVLSDGIISADQPLAVADDIGFHALWESASITYAHRRRIPFAGAALGPIEVVATQGPPGAGMCQTFGTGPFGLGASLGSGNPLVSFAATSLCLGTWLTGVPGAVFSPFPPIAVIDSAPASFARGTSATAALWRRVALDLDTSQTFSAIVVNRIEPSPLPSALQLTGTPSLVYQPVVAAVGDLFMVAWVTGSQVRGLRFMFPGTVLDGTGGFLIASLSGTAEAPSMTSDGTRFVVAWRQGTAGDDELRAVHVDTDGTVEEPAPLLLASAPAITDLGIAAGTSATWAAFATAEPSGARAMRIVEVP